MKATVLILIAALATMDLCASVLVFRSSFATHRQKIYQLLLVWLIPVIGAVFIIVFYHDSSMPASFVNNSPGDLFSDIDTADFSPTSAHDLPDSQDLDSH